MTDPATSPEPVRNRLRNWRLWVRNIHFYSSLLLSGAFLFFALTGLLAGRPELFHADATALLPASIQLEKAELVGYLKAKLPAATECTAFEQDENHIAARFTGPEGVQYAVDITLPDRVCEVIQSRSLPAGIPLSEPSALAAHLARPFPGKLDEGSVETDGDLIYFTIDSVWVQTSITVNMADRNYQVRQRNNPLVTALTNLHRGKNAGHIQRLFVDLTAAMLVVATITGIILGLQTRNTRTRLVTLILIAVSFILAVAMTANR